MYFGTVHDGAEFDIIAFVIQGTGCLARWTSLEIVFKYYFVLNFLITVTVQRPNVNHRATFCQPRPSGFGDITIF